MPTKTSGTLFPKVFINYRREDGAAFAGRIYDRVSRLIPDANIFMDVDTLKPGADFAREIEKAISGCDIFLALIGPKWLTSRDVHEEPRINNPNDFVRLEIAEALKRNMTVIPVLIDGAEVPAASQLPDNLVSLSRRNAIELRHSRFTDDIRHLLEQTGLSAFEKPSNFVELEKTFSALGDVPLRQIGFIFSSFFFWIWTRLSSFYGLTASLLSSLQGLTRDVADKIGWQKSLLLFSIVLSATFYYLFGRFVLRPIAMVLHGFVPYSTPTATGFASAIALMAAALVIFSTCLDLTSLPRKCIKIFVYSLCFSYLFGFMSNAIEDGLMQIRQATLHGRIVDSSVKLGASDLGYGALRPFEIFDNPFGRNIYAQSGREAEGNLLSPDQPETDRLERCPVEESYLCYKYGVSRNIVYFAHFKTTDTSYPFYDMDTAFDSAAGLSLNSLVAIQEIKNFGAVFTTWLVSYILYLFFVFWLWRIMGRSRKRLDAARRLFAGTI